MLKKTGLIALGVMVALQATAEQSNVTAKDIEDASFDSSADTTGRNAQTARLQILLDRAGMSSGEINAQPNALLSGAISAFEQREGLDVDGKPDEKVWEHLQAYADKPLTKRYQITDEDGEGLVDEIPRDYAEKAKMETQGYTSIRERIAERFHMNEDLLASLNPDSDFEPGDKIVVVDPSGPERSKVSRIVVDTDSGRVTAFDQADNIVADYPATVGSDENPAPKGDFTVSEIALDPNYTYDPDKNFQRGDNTEVHIIPPGPNGPVGDAWIGLNEPTYGLHGTAFPSTIGDNETHGCIRMTNWDANELLHLVTPDKTKVEVIPASNSSESDSSKQSEDDQSDDKKDAVS